MNFQIFKLVLEKAEEPDQIANICWIIEKAREFQKNIYFCFIDYAKASDCVAHNKLWKILKEMGIPDHLTCLQGFPDSSVGKESPCRAGDPCLIPELGRSSGEGKVYPLQYSCPKNSKDREAWQATVHGIPKSDTTVQLSLSFTF